MSAARYRAACDHAESGLTCGETYDADPTDVRVLAGILVPLAEVVIPLRVDADGAVTVHTGPTPARPPRKR